MAGNWKKSAKGFLEKSDTVLKNANKVMQVANDANETYKHYQYSMKFRNSEEGQTELAEAKRLNAIGEVVFKVNIILIVLMIAATIILCVTGNDIVLRLLHI